MISTITPQQFVEIKNNEMSLLHHVAFDGNLEMLKMMANLPYFKEIVDDGSNEVL